MTENLWKMSNGELISEETRQRIIDEYLRTGESIRVIGDNLGVSYTSVSKIISQYLKDLSNQAQERRGKHLNP